MCAQISQEAMVSTRTPWPFSRAPVFLPCIHTGTREGVMTFPVKCLSEQKKPTPFPAPMERMGTGKFDAGLPYNYPCMGPCPSLPGYFCLLIVLQRCHFFLRSACSDPFLQIPLQCKENNPLTRLGAYIGMQALDLKGSNIKNDPFQKDPCPLQQFYPCPLD